MCDFQNVRFPRKSHIFSAIFTIILNYYQDAFEVLQASNYLQMDKVQDATVEYLKKLVSKTNFLTVYDFAVLRGITSLSSYITSTIIKPAEVAAQIFLFYFLSFDS